MPLFGNSESKAIDKAIAEVGAGEAKSKKKLAKSRAKAGGLEKGLTRLRDELSNPNSKLKFSFKVVAGKEVTFLETTITAYASPHAKDQGVGVDHITAAVFPNGHVAVLGDTYMYDAMSYKPDGIFGPTKYMGFYTDVRMTSRFNKSGTKKALAFITKKALQAGMIIPPEKAARAPKA
jgi:hypothetical protein